MSLFEEDRIEREKADPVEASSTTFVNVPVTLLALLLGFGITYLALKTDNTSMTPGDSRTPPSELATAAATPTAGGGAGTELSALMAKGKQVYTTTCQACHQSTGAGIPGAFPPLAGSEWVNGPAKRMIAIVLHGVQGEITVKGEKFQGVMPPFQTQLKAEDIAAVVTYVRNSFGNKADLVSPKLVEETTEATKSKTGSWNGESDLNAQKWD